MKYVSIGLAVICMLINCILIKKSFRQNFWCMVLLANAAYIVLLCFREGNAAALLRPLTINLLAYMSLCDLKERQIGVIPISLYVISGLISCFLINFNELFYVLIFAAVIFVVLFVASKKSAQAIGMADVILIASTALVDTPSTVMGIIVLSMLLSMVAGIIAAIRNKTGIKTQIPYVPFLFLAYYFIQFTL